MGRKTSKAVVGLLMGALPFMGSGEEVGEPDFEVSDSYWVVEILEELKQEPLDLNTASASELTAIPWFTPLMAEEIVAHRERVKGFASLDDLRSLPRFSDELFEKVRPYLKVVRVRGKRGLPVKLILRSRLVERSPISEGYVGGARKVYNRVRVDYGEKLSLGFLAEKDAYERSYRDFLCGYITISNLKPLKRAVLGNYQLDFAEGLLFSPPRFIMKTSGIIKGSERGLKPYASSDENSSLLGGALALWVSGIQFIPFYSNSELDATLGESGRVTSLYGSGYHRTQTELDKVDKVTEELFGSRIEYRKSDWLKVGLTGCRGTYEPGFEPQVLGYYSFAGDAYSLLGADFDLLLGDLDFFGEYAKSLGLGDGGVLGLSLNLPTVELSTLVRDYDDDFSSPHSSGFSDVGDKNESGVIGAVNYRLSKRTKLRGYSDLFHHPRPAYRALFPLSGGETVGEFEHLPLKDLTLRIRYKSKAKEKPTDMENGSKLLSHRREHLRLQADWEESRRLSFRFRGEVSRAKIADLASEERGGMLLFGLVAKPVDGLRLEGRTVYFDTDSYEARIYQYENDLPGVMRNQALHGRGRRSYLLLQGKLRKNLKASLKYGITEKEEEATEIDYGLQLDVRL